MWLTQPRGELGSTLAGSAHSRDGTEVPVLPGRACRQPDVRCPGGHFLNGPPDVAGAQVPARHFIQGCLSVSWRIGGERVQVEQCGQLDEVVGEKPPADDTIVVMRELARRHRRPGPEAVDDHVVEAPERAGVGVALQAVSDPLVADAADLQETGGFDGARGKYDAPGDDGAVLVAGDGCRSWRRPGTGSRRRTRNVCTQRGRPGAVC